MALEATASALRQRNRERVERELRERRVQVDSVPLDLQFGLSNACNLSCAFCSDHYPGSKVPVRRFDAAQLGEVVELIPHLSAAAFHGVGEFFLDPQFEPLMARCSEHGVTVLLNTNATVLGDKHRRLLREHRGGLHVTMSFDAATPATYRKVRGGDFGQVVANARAILKILSERSFYSGSTAAFVLMRENLGEAVDFLKMAHELGFEHAYFARLFELTGEAWVARRGGWAFDYYLQGPWAVPAQHDRVVRAIRQWAARLGQGVTTPWFYGRAGEGGEVEGGVGVERGGAVPEVGELGIGDGDGDGEREESGHGHGHGHGHESGPSPVPEGEPAGEVVPEVETVLGAEVLCDKPWKGRAVVATNGDLHPCCFMLEPVGNTKAAGSFRAAWNGEGMQRLRAELGAGRFPQACATSNCPVYQRRRPR